MGDRLVGEPHADRDAVTFPHVATVGTRSGGWCPTSPPFGSDADQRADDARAVCFDGAPLTEALDLLGAARARLFASAEKPAAFFAVRICDVAPDGSSFLVTRGILNATRRNGFARPEPLAPGEVVVLDIPLKTTSWRFEPGHRIRIAIAGSDFPTIWPAPYRGNQLVWLGGDRATSVELPRVTAPERTLVFTVPPESLPRTAETWAGAASWQTIRDELREATTVRVAERHTIRPLGGEVEVAAEFEATTAVSDRDPAVVSAVGVQKYEHRRMGVTTKTVGRTAITSTERACHLQRFLS